MTLQKLKIQLLDSYELMLVLDVNVDAVLVSLNTKIITKLQCINKCHGNFNLPLLLHNCNVTCTHLKSSKCGYQLSII